MDSHGIFDLEEASGHDMSQELARWLCDQFDKKRLVYDLGCGNGAYSRALFDAGFNPMAYEGTVGIEKFAKFSPIHIHDLTTPLVLSGEQVLCLEVGEHIPAEYEVTIIDTICKATATRAIISWAVEGQPGRGHVNCKNNDYVIAQFAKRGLILNKELTAEGRKFAGHLEYFANTLLVFDRFSYCATLAEYDFSYLAQPDNQCTSGAIQNDEALLLFAVIRCCRLRRILEIGTKDGYSARNFCEAVSIFPDGVVYGCDSAPNIPVVAPNHKHIPKWAVDLRPEDCDGLPLDLIFFDCHDISEPAVLGNLKSLITDDTILVFHDTNLQYRNTNGTTLAYARSHQIVEPVMVNTLHAVGYDAFLVRTRPEDHDEVFPLRMGLAMMQKFKGV